MSLTIRAMTNEIRNKLADIIDRVKDPENGVSVSQMNLVAGIKHHQETNEFEVYMNAIGSTKACCMVLQLNAYSTMELLLKKEIEKEFPDSKIVFMNA